VLLLLAFAFAGVPANRASARHTPRAAFPVSVFPSPGTQYNRPQTQISFRGVGARGIGRLTVVGSRSGAHRGRLRADSDGQGASFIPSEPFTAGETVIVHTSLNVLGGSGGRFQFKIGHVAPLIPVGHLGGIPRLTRNGVMRFHSQPQFEPASFTVTTDTAPMDEGDIFVAPQNGPVQDGPMILDPRGRLVWFSPYPVARNVFVNDFRVQDLYGQPVLTWWQGFRDAGFGQSRGIGVILNRNYRRIATVRAGNGLDAGSHEFLVTPQGDAYITASSPVNLRSHRGTTIDSVVQEIDIRTGLVLFEWHALDHVPLSDTYPIPANINASFDPYHVNSISLDAQGNLLLSLRNTSAVYCIDHRDGHILWTLGGKHSSFTMGPGTGTYLQHDAVAQPDGTVTIFDNGGAPPFLHGQSRALRERLDMQTMTATRLGEYDHSPPLRAAVEGGLQMLPDGDAFVGWGSAPFFSEYGPSDQQIYSARFNEPVVSYRAYRFPWDAQPPTAPAVAVSKSVHAVRHLYVSWNGATDVSSWRVLVGNQPRRLVMYTTSPTAGFETTITIRTRARYVAVQALNANGWVLSRSRVLSISPRRAPDLYPDTARRSYAPGP
jgi:hypothetical protein